MNLSETLSNPRFQGNVYFNSIMTGFSEVFGNLITVPVIRAIGVKKTAILFNLIAGASMITTLVMLEADPNRLRKSSKMHNNSPRHSFKSREVSHNSPKASYPPATSMSKTQHNHTKVSSGIKP